MTVSTPYFEYESASRCEVTDVGPYNTLQSRVAICLLEPRGEFGFGEVLDPIATASATRADSEYLSIRLANGQTLAR
jgi:hypothetical protein